MTLKGPNDTVFNAKGGLWFTDLRKVYGRSADGRGAVYYARTDGRLIREVARRLITPKGPASRP